MSECHPKNAKRKRLGKREEEQWLREGRKRVSLKQSFCGNAQFKREKRSRQARKGEIREKNGRSEAAARRKWPSGNLLKKAMCIGEKPT